MKSEHEQKFITANGIRHNTLIWNPEGKETIVCLHGFVCSAFYFVKLASILKQKYRVVAFDFRGHGLSSWVKEGGYYHFFNYVADLDALWNQISSGPTHIVAHSMGGMVANYYLGAKPGQAKTLTLIEGEGPPRNTPFSEAPEKLEKWLSQMIQPQFHQPMESLDIAMKKLKVYNRTLPDDFAEYLAREMTKKVDGKYIWIFDPLHKTMAPQAFYSEQALEFFRKITCPVLRIKGSLSPYKITQEELHQKAFSQAITKTMEGSSHFPHTDKPEELAELIEDFLQEHA